MLPRIANIVGDQDGLITRTQAVAAGMSASAVDRALRNRWQVVLPGVYASFTGPLSVIHRLRAAVLYGGPGAMVTGPMACALSGFNYAPDPNGIVDVLVGLARQRVDTGFVRMHRSSRVPKQLTVWQDDSPEAQATRAFRPSSSGEDDPLSDDARPWTIRIAPAPRAVMDTVRLRRLDLLGAHSGRLPAGTALRLLQDTRALLCEFVQRRSGTAADLAAELDAAPRAGTATARLAMDDVVAGCRSAPECELRDLFRKSSVLPEPRWNKRLPGYYPPPGEPMIYPDACLAEARLVIEVNSTQWHKIGLGPEKTDQRHARYAELGWLVIPVSPRRIRSEPDAVLRQIENTYLRRLD